MERLQQLVPVCSDWTLMEEWTPIYVYSPSSRHQSTSSTTTVANTFWINVRVHWNCSGSSVWLITFNKTLHLCFFLLCFEMSAVTELQCNKIHIRRRLGWKLGSKTEDCCLFPGLGPKIKVTLLLFASGRNRSTSLPTETVIYCKLIVHPLQYESVWLAPQSFI